MGEVHRFWSWATSPLSPALPARYQGRPRVSKPQARTRRPGGAGWTGVRAARGSETHVPQAGGFRLQPAPRGAYLGRGAEAAAESGASRPGEGGQHGWSRQGADQQVKELVASK